MVFNFQVNFFSVPSMWVKYLKISWLTSAITINQYCLKNKNHLNITEHPYIFLLCFLKSKVYVCP